MILNKEASESFAKHPQILSYLEIIDFFYGEQWKYRHYLLSSLKNYKFKSSLRSSPSSIIYREMISHNLNSY